MLPEDPLPLEPVPAPAVAALLPLAPLPAELPEGTLVLTDGAPGALVLIEGARGALVLTAGGFWMTVVVLPPKAPLRASAHHASNNSATIATVAMATVASPQVPRSTG